MQLLPSSNRLQGASPEDLYKRSNMTQRQLLMWIGQKVQADVPDFNMPSLFLVDGALEEGPFCEAAQTLVRSSDSLRTVIREHDGVPRQQVLDRLDANVEIVDLRDYPDGDAHTRMMALVRERSLRPFALHRRLVRFTLFHLPARTLGDGECAARSAWFVNLHHIIADGGSMRLIFDHLSALYEKAVDARAALAPLPLSHFSDYVAAEHAFTQSPQYVSDQEYWSAQLARVEPVLFYGKPVPAGSSAAHRIHLDLGKDRTRRIGELARAHGNFWGVHSATQNLLAAVLYSLVHRMGPNAAPTVAIAFHNRSKALEDTIGLIMQTLPVRVEVTDDDTFYSLMERVTEKCLEALEHRGCAVANPLHRRAWEVVLNYLPTEFGHFAGFPIEHQWVFPEHVNAAMTVTVHDFSGRGTLCVDFDVLDEAFDHVDRTRVARHFTALLDAMLEDIDQSVHAVDILTADEGHGLLVADTDPPAVQRTYVEQFEETARGFENSTAVRLDEACWSYSTINAAANRLARYLIELGVERGDWVGIYLRPGVAVVVSVLGILKAGAAYLPLDPSYPVDRIRFMLADGNARIVVTEEDLRDEIPQAALHSAQRHLVVIDGAQVAEAMQRCSPYDLPPVASPDDFAYVIYTSGSTGRPKGVRIQHRALASFINAARGTWVDAGDVVPAASPLSFDLHLGDLLLPLAVGATVVPVGREIAAEGLRFKAALERMQPTAFFATPATFRMLVDAGWQGASPLKLVCGGEAMSQDLARELLSRSNALLNAYGPSETTCYVLTHAVTEAVPSVPIGKPLPGVRLYVSDRHGMPLPQGIPGELVIAGPQVGFDYLNQPELTLQKFIPDPFSGDANARAYRSGDLTRIERNGTVTYLGRIDHQVKIRGYRIELGEIENMLTQHPVVRQALVMAREDRVGDKFLAAYVVADCDATQLESELKTHLRQHLPEFMVPSTIVLMDEFPITANGKVDRAAMPAPATRKEASDADLPGDLLGFQITKMFEDVLGVQPVGIHDNFFELGGNSLRAVRLMAHIECVLDRQLPSLMTLFEAPTPHQLSAVLSRDGWQPVLPTLVPLQPRGEAPPFFCVHAFIGDVCRDLGRHAGLEQPFYGLQPRGLDGREKPLNNIPDMAAYYIDEMRRVQPDGPYFIGGYSFGGLVAMEMATQLRMRGQEVAMVVVIDAGPMNLRPRSLRGRIRQAINAPLILIEKVVDLLKKEPPGQLLQTIRTKIQSRVVRRRVKSCGSANFDEPREAVMLVERMYGMSRWPKNYQRIARINLLAMMRHVPRSYDGPLTLIRRRERQYRFAFEVADWGWRELVPHVDVHYVDGNHDEIMVEPGVCQVGEILQHCLRAARNAQSPGRLQQPKAS